MAIARRVAPCCRLSQYADPTDHPASLLAALLLREQLRLTCRAAEDRLRLADWRRRRFGLRIVPDHATRWGFGRRRLTPGLLAAALGETVARVAGSAGRGGWPSPRSAFWLSHASRWFERRAERDRRPRGWLTWSPAMGVEPQRLLAPRVRPGPAGDFGGLVPLAGAAPTVAPFDRRVADAGYASKANPRFCRDEPGDAGDRRTYRQRWKAATVTSVAKRRWGEALSARLDPAPETQALLTGVVYNLNPLVRPVRLDWAT
jgi:hypothetical protein